jgi:hypothetical protein
MFYETGYGRSIIDRSSKLRGPHYHTPYKVQEAPADISVRIIHDLISYYIRVPVFKFQLLAYDCSFCNTSSSECVSRLHPRPLSPFYSLAFSLRVLRRRKMLLRPTLKLLQSNHVQGDHGKLHIRPLRRRLRHQCLKRQNQLTDRALDVPHQPRHCQLVLSLLQLLAR